MTIGAITKAVLSQVFTAAGVFVWMLAKRGEPPFGRPHDFVVWGIFGGIFCGIGIAGAAYALLADSAIDRRLSAVLVTTVWVLFGLCFLSVAVFHPDQIVGAFSVNGTAVGKVESHWSGAVAFSVIGAICLLLTKRIYRAYLRAFERAHRRHAA